MYSINIDGFMGYGNNFLILISSSQVLHYCYKTITNHRQLMISGQNVMFDLINDTQCHNNVTYPPYVCHKPALIWIVCMAQQQI